MKLTTQKRMAAKVLEVGKNRIWFDPLRLDEIKQAITREDIKDLIKEKAIRPRAGKRYARKEKRKRKGAGRTKMTVSRRKRKYIFKIRKIRSYLREEKTIPKEMVREIRKLAKAGQFKNLRNVKDFIRLKK